MKTRVLAAAAALSCLSVGHVMAADSSMSAEMKARDTGLRKVTSPTDFGFDYNVHGMTSASDGFGARLGGQQSSIDNEQYIYDNSARHLGITDDDVGRGHFGHIQETPF